MLFQGHSIAGIAHEIRFHRSTLYRELEHNSSKFGYRPDIASQQYLSRRQRPTKLTTKKYVVSKDQKPFMLDLKLVYKATSKDLAEHHLLD